MFVEFLESIYVFFIFTVLITGYFCSVVAVGEYK